MNQSLNVEDKKAPSESLFFTHFEENTCLPDRQAEFTSPIGMGLASPELFTFPFNYEPHPLSLLAAKELQRYIENQNEWQHNFGFEGEEGAIGKMFGVLIVRNQKGELGYLAAFSGKLAGKNHHARFVPPVFDILEEDGFFRKEEIEINQINGHIEQLEAEEHYILLKAKQHDATAQSIVEINALKQLQKDAKAKRDVRRSKAQMTLPKSDFDALQAILNHESADYCYQVKDLTRTWKRRFAETQAQINVFSEQINILKEARKMKSAQLQQRLFDNYSFLNQAGEQKNLGDIFPISEQIQPPAGAGECAAPKLLQYAFLHQMTPLAMAEFWWGKSPNSEIRKHGHFYPACKSKCEPILKHMLKGIKMDADPALINPAIGKNLEVVYEDDFIMVVNKPADFYSVPGKNVEDSVFSRLKSQYPLATGPLMVHRLDVATSGLLLIAKTKAAHQNLQIQFLKREVKKRYVAILDGIIEQNEGIIDLPLRVDLDNRPYQLVCYDHGKPAKTFWKVVERRDNRTKIHFYPITGRTHQLRVHAAHPLGLNAPIVGDELYGTRADRLYLHAENLEFKHPNTEGVQSVTVLAGF